MEEVEAAGASRLHRLMQAAVTMSCERSASTHRSSRKAETTLGMDSGTSAKKSWYRTTHSKNCSGADGCGHELTGERVSRSTHSPSVDSGYCE